MLIMPHVVEHDNWDMSHNLGHVPHRLQLGHTADAKTHSGQSSLMVEYRALLSKYRALLSECRALLSECRALSRSRHPRANGLGFF